MKKLSSLLLFLIFPIFLGSCQSKNTKLPKGLYAEINTNQGSFVIKLYHEAAPLTVANFVSLAEGTNDKVSEDLKGKKFYDGVVFHRIIKDFMIQGGDPQGTGRGGPGYSFPDEIVDTLQFDRKGLLAMANSGPATNGSQFFVTLAPTTWLNGKHTIFGEVTEGQDVVDKLGAVETTKPGDKPVNDVIIQSVKIINNGKIKIPSFSKELDKLAKENEAKEKEANKVIARKAAELVTARSSAETLESGIKIHVNKKGSGPKPKIGDRVLVDYAGYLVNGHLFDSNMINVAKSFGKYDERRNYEPMLADYSMNAQLISGFKEALITMSTGDKITVFIPPHLAYGEKGVSGVIPPNSDLIFEIVLVGIVPN